MTEDNNEINDTAFWMAGCRAELPELSQDIFAHLWLNNASRERHLNYTTNVSPTENIALSLRNRFFLKKIRDFFANEPEAVMINIGSGFSSYPFLLDKERRYFEADCQANIAKKICKIKELQAKDLLPVREIEFFTVDLCDQSQILEMFEAIKKFAGEKKSFILLEGLVYYLPPESTVSLFECAAAIQSSASRLGVVSWDPEVFSWPVYKRFEKYFFAEGREIPDFTCHDRSSFLDLSGYRLIEQTGYVEISEIFGLIPTLKKDDDVFWERISVLEKT